MTYVRGNASAMSMVPCTSRGTLSNLGGGCRVKGCICVKVQGLGFNSRYL